VDRTAPGEFGHPFSVPSRLGPSVERQVEEGYRRHAFNVLVSDLISVHRNLGDKREDVCKVRVSSTNMLVAAVLLILILNGQWSQKYTLFYKNPVNSELRLAALNFLRIFSLNCS